jgi:hypothetical protein
MKLNRETGICGSALCGLARKRQVARILQAPHLRRDGRYLAFLWCFACCVLQASVFSGLLGCVAKVPRIVPISLDELWSKDFPVAPGSVTNVQSRLLFLLAPLDPGALQGGAQRRVLALADDPEDVFPAEVEDGRPIRRWSVRSVDVGAEGDPHFELMMGRLEVYITMDKSLSTVGEPRELLFRWGDYVIVSSESSGSPVAVKVLQQLRNSEKQGPLIEDAVYAWLIESGVLRYDRQPIELRFLEWQLPFEGRPRIDGVQTVALASGGRASLQRPGEEVYGLWFYAVHVTEGGARVAFIVLHSGDAVAYECTRRRDAILWDCNRCEKLPWGY